MQKQRGAGDEQVYHGEGRTKARRYRRLVVLVTWLVLAFVVPLSGLVWRGGHWTSFTTFMIAWVVILQVSLSLVAARFMERREQPTQLILSSEGIRMEQGSVVTLPLIAWGELKEIRTLTILGIPILKLIPKDPSALRGRLAAYQVSGSFLVGLMSLPLSAKQLAEEIAAYRSALAAYRSAL